MAHAQGRVFNPDIAGGPIYLCVQKVILMATCPKCQTKIKYYHDKKQPIWHRECDCLHITAATFQTLSRKAHQVHRGECTEKEINQCEME